MANSLKQMRPAAPPRRSEPFVAEQLRRAEARLRWSGPVTALLGWSAATLAFTLLLVLTWQFAPFLRLLALLLYLPASIAFLGLAVLRPLLLPINPRYAARKL